MSIKWRQAGDFHPFDWLGQFVSIRMNWRIGFEKRSQFHIGWKRATNSVVAHSSPLRCFKQCCRWIEWEQRVDDSALDRSTVNRATAELLRARMRASLNLVYANSANAADSKWMPWELGFFDGIKPSHIFVLPLVASSDNEYKGREYLNLYPNLDARRSTAISAIWGSS
jgi:hypothetical protein